MDYNVNLEPGVRLYDLYRDAGRATQFIGQRGDANNPATSRYVFHPFGFSNPYSANMYAYIFHRYHDAEVAKSTVEDFETKLATNAGSRFVQFICSNLINWQAVGSGAIAKVIDPGGLVQSMIIAAAGVLVDKIRLEQANPWMNPYPPDSSQNEYTDYAIAYWGKNPTNGPAYKVIAYNPH